MKKKSYRRMAALILSLGVICSVNLTAFARGYLMKIPSPFVGSLRSTAEYTKENANTPYVKPNLNTISTNYFLSTEPGSRITATNIIPISNTVKHTFSWNSGYGGEGIEYCLSAYPNVTGAYTDYIIQGDWSE